MIAGAFFFSIMSLLVKVSGQRLPSQEIVFARSLIMAVVCAAMLLRAGEAVRGGRPGLLLLRGLFGFGSLSCFYYAVVHLPLADATVIQYTNAIFTAVFAVFVLGERVRRRELLCLLVTLAGVLVVARPSFLFASAARLPAFPVLVALAGACFSGAAYVTVRKLEGEHPLVVILHFSIVGVLGSIPAVVRHGVIPGAWDLLVLVGVGLTTLGGQVCLTKGLYLERAARASSVGLIQVVFAALLGALFFREFPDLPALLGTALIIGSILALGMSGKALAPVPGSPSIPAGTP
jgi:drug/metabolite transporter (DMT)-like permease